ncbi:hypothetical protein [Salibacterium aidingense]|uniref:hypothetical protein n=1 Tax=Salibacterium aidingense TaxID=384933 RepID=UPI003BBBB159
MNNDITYAMAVVRTADEARIINANMAHKLRYSRFEAVFIGEDILSRHHKGTRPNLIIITAGLPINVTEKQAEWFRKGLFPFVDDRAVWAVPERFSSRAEINDNLTEVD